MENLLLTIDPGTVDWSRAQFALTAIYHWLFVPLTLGLAVIMGIMETCYYRTRKEFWRSAARSQIVVDRRVGGSGAQQPSSGSDSLVLTLPWEWLQASYLSSSLVPIGVITLGLLATSSVLH
mgnify:CR=1 FL=1